MKEEGKDRDKKETNKERRKEDVEKQHTQWSRQKNLFICGLYCPGMTLDNSETEWKKGEPEVTMANELVLPSPPL